MMFFRQKIPTSKVRNPSTSRLICGPIGSGKSTLLEALTGTRPALSGNCSRRGGGMTRGRQTTEAKNGSCNWWLLMGVFNSFVWRMTKKGKWRWKFFFVYPCLRCAKVNYDYFLILLEMMEAAFKTWSFSGKVLNTWNGDCQWKTLIKIMERYQHYGDSRRSLLNFLAVFLHLFHGNDRIRTPWFYAATIACYH